MKTFKQLATDLSKPGDEIAALMSAQEAHLWHMATGVSGEAGELLDAVKKSVLYKKPLDRENVVEELGDLRFYMAGLMNALSISEQEILYATNKKLGKRYAAGSYSNAQAQERADKAELPEDLPAKLANDEIERLTKTVDNCRHDFRVTLKRAEKAEAKEREACERIADMLRQDDGEAFFEVEKFLKRHAPDLYDKIGMNPELGEGLRTEAEAQAEEEQK